MTRPATLLAADAAIEGVTGLVLIIVPGVVAELLFASPLAGAGVIMARIGGMGLVGLAVACWLARGEASLRAGVAGMFVYNLLTGVYLLFIGFGGVAVGIFLWPVALFHSVVAVLFAVFRHQRPMEN